MKGYQHEMIAISMFIPIYLYINLHGLLDGNGQLILFGSVFIGALAPDVDATDAKIFHGDYEYFAMKITGTT